jgi:hypothetical protein
MLRKKRNKKKDFDSAKDTESSTSTVGFELDFNMKNINGPHSLTSAQRKEIAKHYRDYNITPRFQRGEVVFLTKDVIQDECTISKNSLCWVEQISVTLAEIKEERESGSQEESQPESQPEMQIAETQRYTFKLKYILLHEGPTENYKDYIMFSVDQDDIAENISFNDDD